MSTPPAVTTAAEGPSALLNAAEEAERLRRQVAALQAGVAERDQEISRLKARLERAESELGALRKREKERGQREAVAAASAAAHPPSARSAPKAPASSSGDSRKSQSNGQILRQPLGANEMRGQPPPPPPNRKLDSAGSGGLGSGYGGYPMQQH